MRDEQRHSINPRYMGRRRIAHPTKKAGTPVWSGGTVALLSIRNIRQGETIQGFRCPVSFRTKEFYSISSPRPIITAGAYLVSLARLDEAYQAIFTGGEADDSTIPSVELSKACFQRIFNDYYAFPDSKMTVAADAGRLNHILRTMEVVGDDKVELSYDEWIYAQTGYTPFRLGIEVLSRGLQTAKSYDTFLPRGLDEPAARFGGSISLKTKKNHTCVEPSFLCVVAGFWEQPNKFSAAPADALDDDVDGFMVPGTPRVANALAGTSTFTVDYFLDQKFWLPRPVGEDVVEDSTTTFGDVGDVNVLNFYLQGHFDNDGDWDPRVLAWSATDKLHSFVNEATEGHEEYEMEVRGLMKLRILTDLGLF